VVRDFEDGEKHGFNLLNLAYEGQKACTLTQENHVNAVSFCPFYSKRGPDRNGLLSKEQYCEIAAELTGQQADRDSIYISECGTAAVMQVNAGADVAMVQGCWKMGKCLELLFYCTVLKSSSRY
jgi:hypothetical protein